MIRFVAFGDWGDLSAHSQTISSTLFVLERVLDFIILLGDQFYPDGVSSVSDPKWKSHVIERCPGTLPMYALLGNHDYHLDPIAQIQQTLSMPSWNMPFFYYDKVVPVGNEQLHLWFLDTCLLAPYTSYRLFQHCQITSKSLERFFQLVHRWYHPQMQWLKETLQKSRAKYKMVCGHYPIFSNGPHPSCTFLRSTLVPLFEQHGVQVYISGHQHNAQVIEHHSIYYLTAGCTSHVAFPKLDTHSTIENETRFVSVRPGMFFFQVADQAMTIQYLEAKGNTVLYSTTVPLIKYGKTNLTV